MMKALIGKQMMEIFRGYFYDTKKGKGRSKTGTVLLFVLFGFLMVGVLGGMFTALSYFICRPLADMDMGWLYFAIMGSLGSILGVFASVFTTYSSLYGAKDNDLLLSMPIPVSCIVNARLVSIYMLSMMYVGVVLIPAVLVYWICVGVSISNMLGAIAMFITVTVIVLVLACILGWVVAKISVKLKHKSIATTLISLTGIGIYYFFYFRAQAMLNELILNAMLYGEAIRGKAYAVYLFGRMAEGDPVAAVLFPAIAVICFGLTWLVLVRSYLSLVTMSDRGTRTKYIEKTAKQKSVFGTLLGKEFERFVSSSTYMLNCGFGCLGLIAFGILMLVKGNSILNMVISEFGVDHTIMTLAICGIIGVASTMNDMAAPSVSLEGKSLWIVQMLPVSARQILLAKLSLQLILTEIPVLICGICTAVVLPVSVKEKTTVVIVPLLLEVLLALWAICMGVKFPNLTWTNEIAPVKRGAAPGFSLLGAWVYLVILELLYVWQGWRIGAMAYLGIVIAITIMSCIGLYVWLMKRGTVLFDTL